MYVKLELVYLKGAAVGNLQDSKNYFGNQIYESLKRKSSHKTHTELSSTILSLWII